MIGIAIGLSLILVCSASAIVDNNKNSNAFLCPEKIGAGIVKENIQKFTGSPDEEITCNGMTELPFGKVYEVSTKTGRFSVNAKTGEVESAIIRNESWVRSIDQKDLENIKETVKAFVEKKFMTFVNKNMVLTEARIIDHGDAGKEYLFVWNEMVGEAYTLSAVQVSVLPDWDNSITYTGIDRPLLVDTKPKISQADAQKKALRTFDMGTEAKIQSKLAVIPAGDSQRLAWIVDTVEPDNENMSHGGTVIVDAVSGSVLLTNPIQ